MNTSLNSNITSSLQLACKYMDLGIESLNSHIETIPVGPSRDSFCHVRSKMIDYLERLKSQLRLKDNTVPSKIDLLNSITIIKDRIELSSYSTENEISLSALYNIQCISNSLEELITSSTALENDSYLLLYEISESLKNDFRYLKDSILVSSVL